MRRGLRQRLFRRRKPALPPLYMRTTWPDFEVRMRKASAIDMAIMMGEVSRAELLRQQVTRPLPVVLAEAETVADARCWWYSDETAKVACGIGIDRHATQPMGVCK